LLFIPWTVVEFAQVALFMVEWIVGVGLAQQVAVLFALL